MSVATKEKDSLTFPSDGTAPRPARGKGKGKAKKAARPQARRTKGKKKGKGGPKPGALPPIEERVYRNPKAVFETTQQAGGAFGMITGHLSKQFNLAAVKRVAQGLSAKRQINLKRYKTVDQYASRAIRNMLNMRIIRVVRKG